MHTLNNIFQYIFNFNDTNVVTSWIVVLGALTIITLERIFPYDKRQKFFRKGLFNDFFWYTIVQNYILALFIGFLINYIDNHTGISRLQLLSNVPIWAIVLGSLLFHDLYIYWFHRWMHHNKYLWRLHEAHHSTEDVDWLSGSRSHAFEILINQTIEFAPFVLLGAPAEAAVIKGAFSAIWGMWIHSNVDVKMGKLQCIINGPEMHRWHHSNNDDEAHNRNFATKFAFWDFIFGTDYYPQNKKPKEYGISNYFPSNYLKQFLYAFRKFEE